VSGDLQGAKSGAKVANRGSAPERVDVLRANGRCKMEQ
jgi:hypothetical protein